PNKEGLHYKILNHNPSIKNQLLDSKGEFG
ncbi:hypothetical protein Goshw_029362, partial [Gossypium schwendimanii]|nr:hypothetical protein [Gossypium schwendimanii]